MSEAVGNNGWPSPKQMTAWLGVASIVAGILLWVTGLLYISRSQYEADQRDIVRFQVETKGDVKYIKAGVDDLKTQLHGRH